MYTGEVGGETSCGRNDIIVNQQLYGFVSAVCVCVEPTLIEVKCSMDNNTLGHVHVCIRVFIKEVHVTNNKAAASVSNQNYDVTTLHHKTITVQPA